MYYLVKNNKYENKNIYSDKELKERKFFISSCGNYIKAGVDDRGRICYGLAVADEIIAEIEKRISSEEELIAIKLEQVIKEWEDLGYKVEKNNFLRIELSKEIKENNEPIDRATIYIDIPAKVYYKRNIVWSMLSISFQEHQLLTKTFKALGWE